MPKSSQWPSAGREGAPEPAHTVQKGCDIPSYSKAIRQYTKVKRTEHKLPCYKAVAVVTSLGGGLFSFWMSADKNCNTHVALVTALEILPVEVVVSSSFQVE